MFSSYLSPKTGDLAALSLGCMNFGQRTSRADALRIVDRALDAGITLLDTANVYTNGESERIVGQALRGRRDAVCVASKVGAGRVGRASEGLSPERVLAACDESLSRLGVDSIDLYYLHVPDPNTPPEATLTAVEALLESGKIRNWGVSNYASWQILHWQRLAVLAGLPAPAVAQQLYNALIRQLDVEYFRFAKAFPIHTTVYNPLAGGLLTGAHRFESPQSSGRFHKNTLYQRRYWRPALFAALDRLAGLAAAEGLTFVQLAYAFVLRHPGVDSVLVGPGSEAHLEAAIAARDVVLSAETLTAMVEVYRELVGTDASYAR